jgi:hypothetical protein
MSLRRIVICGLPGYTIYFHINYQHSMSLRRIVICGLPGSTVYFHIMSQAARFSETRY